MVDQFRALGCTRLSIAFREGPYDWEALEAFAAEIVRARLTGGARSSCAGLDRAGASSYLYRMSKKAISVTLRPENLLWLRGQTHASSRRSVSETLDALISEARAGARPTGTIRSVVGSIRIRASDPGLDAGGRGHPPPLLAARGGSPPAAARGRAAPGPA